MKKIIMVIAVIMLAAIIALSVLFPKQKEAAVTDSGIPPHLTDSEKFALDYPLVGSGNIFVYRTAAETVNILENGTGIVFMGFKECPWCQYYAAFLHDIAQETEISKIFYCDIREDRQNNTGSYQKIVSILSGSLQYDDEGRPRVYVPDLTVVNGGNITGRDFETSKETLGFNTPEEYWNGDRVNLFKERLGKIFRGNPGKDDMGKNGEPCGCD